MKILVTGVSGYVGSKIAEDLLRKGSIIAGVDNNSESSSFLANKSNFKFYKADITDARTFPEEIRKADVLVHCAALVHKKSHDLSRKNYFRINYEGTKNILNFSDKERLKQIIFLSTVSVYGDVSNGVVRDENIQTTPVDFYGESKLAAENAIKEFSDKHKIPYTIFRLTPVYGEFFLLNINKRICLPKQLAFYKVGSGEQRMSLLSVNNVVDAVTESINNKMFFNEIFNVSDFQDYSINQIIIFLKELCSQRNKPVITIPEAIHLRAFQCLKLLMPKKADYLKYQFNKIAQDSVYSAEKLRSKGTKLKWNLYNTFSKPPLDSTS